MDSVFPSGMAHIQVKTGPGQRGGGAVTNWTSMDSVFPSGMAHIQVNTRNGGFGVVGFREKGGKAWQTIQLNSMKSVVFKAGAVLCTPLLVIRSC
jgi:hypothetical protein